MSTAIAFLSGKGGSGKTTLALSTADLLCRCGVRTLLVDCDLSTNGAAYFYESRMVDLDKDKKFGLLSFDGLLNWGDSPERLHPLNIGETLDFIPSIPGISRRRLKDEEASEHSDRAFQLRGFVKWARDNYEVILFDCQAGYADFLPLLLPMMDADLFVMEADSISASAMRSLHLKIGNFFGRARLYQIFNKATPEEFEIYSKIVGTFFTNIGTLLFDWKIRQAFSRAQVPDLENTGAKYGKDLCGICKIMIPDKAVHEKLGKFSDHLRYRQLKEQREQITEELYGSENRTKKGWRFVSLFVSVSTLIIAISLLYLLYLPEGQFILSGTNSVKITNVLIGFLAVLLCLIGSFLGIDHLEENRMKRKLYQRELKRIDGELEKLNRLQLGDKADQ